MLSSTSLYTDLSAYYDLMCSDINYQQQSHSVQRLHQLFGNGGKRHLDLACGTGPHIAHFIRAGYQCIGLDLNQPMLELARARCHEAEFLLGDMSQFSLTQQVDLVTCFLYSIHYNASIELLSRCIAQVHANLSPGGVFCFNVVDKDKISNNDAVRQDAVHNGAHFVFESGWFYQGQGEQQLLKLRISKTCSQHSQYWQDSHSMVALNFGQLQALLAPWFDVHILAHNYDSIQSWDGEAGNALFVCVKR